MHFQPYYERLLLYRRQEFQMMDLKMATVVLLILVKVEQKDKKRNQFILQHHGKHLPNTCHFSTHFSFHLVLPRTTNHLKITQESQLHYFVILDSKKNCLCECQVYYYYMLLGRWHRSLAIEDGYLSYQILLQPKT